MYYSSLQVCQIVGNNLPAGSEDSSFSVDSEGNVVISYGGTKGSDQKTRYLLICWQQMFYNSRTEIVLHVLMKRYHHKNEVTYTITYCKFCKIWEKLSWLYQKLNPGSYEMSNEILIKKLINKCLMASNFNPDRYIHCERANIKNPWIVINKIKLHLLYHPCAWQKVWVVVSIILSLLSQRAQFQQCWNCALYEWATV